jgi:hypothetical protein
MNTQPAASVDGRWRRAGCACRPVGRQRRPQQQSSKHAPHGSHARLVHIGPFPRLKFLDRIDISVASSTPTRTELPSQNKHVRSSLSGNSCAMVPKPQGSAVQSATHRPLPPLPKLRVRRPNKPETNPCLGVMSSVLGASWQKSLQEMCLLCNARTLRVVTMRGNVQTNTSLQVAGPHPATASKAAHSWR